MIRANVRPVFAGTTLARLEASKEATMATANKKLKPGAISEVARATEIFNFEIFILFLFVLVCLE